VYSGLAFLCVDLTYLFLNSRVGAGHRGFQIRWGECIGRNSFLPVLCRIAGIPVSMSSQERGLTDFKKKTPAPFCCITFHASNCSLWEFHCHSHNVGKDHYPITNR